MVCRLRWACALRVVVWALVTGSASGAAADSINLLWDPTSGLVGYMVHVRTESGWDTQHFDAGSATEFTFPSAIAGQRYCFAVSAYLLTSALEGPNSAEVCGYSDAPPTLDEPGNPFSTVNQPTSLQLAGLDPDGRPLTYGATGLPPGLSVMASTGLISGMVTDLGTYTVTAWASDGVLSASQVFSWTITATPVPDTKPPTVSITGPTSASIYATSEPWLPLSGKSADDRGVTQVTWVNDRGGNGVATGTTSWSVPAIALQSGNNYITVLARDADGNQSTDLLAVTYTGSTPAGSTPPGSTPSLDTTSPSVWITAPTSASTLATTSSTIGVGGTASDDVGVTVIWWATDRGYSGVAWGTANWSVPDLPLVSGNNAITITAVDAAGHQSSDLLFVTYTEP